MHVERWIVDAPADISNIKKEEIVGKP
jgi:hypothetical protein